MPLASDNDTLIPIQLKFALPNAVDSANYLLNPMVPLNNLADGTPAYIEVGNGTITS